MLANALSSETDKIVANYFRCLSEVVSNSDIDYRRILKSVGLSRHSAVDTSIPHDESQFYNVIEAILQENKIDGLGLKYGLRLRLSDYGILGYALLSCSNLRQHIATGSRFTVLTSQRVAMLNRVERNCGVTAFQEIRPTFWPQPFLIEDCLAEIWNVWSSLYPEIQSGRPLKVRLSYAKPEYYGLYDEIFQCPIEFNQSANEIWYPESWLDLTQDTADGTVAEVAAMQCQMAVDQLTKYGNIVDVVRRILMSAPMGTNYRLEDMSDRINISSRTLRKKLHDEGTSYRCIVNELRISTAKAYLKSSSLSIQEIAYMVGYEHSPNFFRAFRKEVGITPDQFRAQSTST